MSGIVNLKGKELYDQFDFKEWSVEKRVLFLEMAIEKRVKCLLAQQDKRFLTSINVVNRRLNIPLQCQNDIELLKKSNDWSTKDFKEKLDKIERAFFGAL